MVHNFAEKSAKLWTFHFLNSILTPWERAGLWSPCRVHYQLGLRVQVGRGYCADHRRWYALIYSVGRRQSNAFRLARARRERRHRPPAAFVAQQRKKLWQPANVSMPRYAMVRDCNIAPPKQPQRSRMMSRTSFLTMTSPLTFSASVRTLSTSASPYPCLFSTRTAQRLYACWERKPVIVASRPPMLTVVFPKSFTPTGESLSRRESTPARSHQDLANRYF